MNTRYTLIKPIDTHKREKIAHCVDYSCFRPITVLSHRSTLDWCIDWTVHRRVFACAELCFPKLHLTRGFACLSPFIFIVRPFVFLINKKPKGLFSRYKYQENENTELLGSCCLTKRGKQPQWRKFLPNRSGASKWWQAIAMASDGKWWWGRVNLFANMTDKQSEPIGVEDSFCGLSFSIRGGLSGFRKHVARQFMNLPEYKTTVSWNSRNGCFIYAWRQNGSCLSMAVLLDTCCT